jgi:hypothetical protein
MSTFDYTAAAEVFAAKGRSATQIRVLDESRRYLFNRNDRAR